ncbi:hypothetical protein Leryth_009522, partial [Lithospermum erythrorhizon]
NAAARSAGPLTARNINGRIRIQFLVQIGPDRLVGSKKGLIFIMVIVYYWQGNTIMEGDRVGPNKKGKYSVQPPIGTHETSHYLICNLNIQQMIIMIKQICSLGC